MPGGAVFRKCLSGPVEEGSARPWSVRHDAAVMTCGGILKRETGRTGTSRLAVGRYVPGGTWRLASKRVSSARGSIQAANWRAMPV